MEYITVGEIVRAHGIIGEVKVKPLTADAERFEKLRVLYIGDKPYKILGLRIDKDYVYIKLQGIDDRNAAEKLRGKFLQIDRINAVELDENEYFIADLIGCEVNDDCGETLGKIADITQNGGAVDVITVKMPSGKECRFPFLNRVVSCVDISRKKFIVIRKLLDEVCVYDD